MPSKPAVPKVGTQTRGDKGLAVKDTLREVRFNVKHGARKLVQAVEAATHRHHDATLGPLGLLGEPLNLAVRTTATLLSTVDHAAVDLLSSDGPYRAMTVPLRSSVSYFSGPQPSPDVRAFATDHHWRYRHWLAMNQFADVFVHEQAIAMAGSQVAGADAKTPVAPNVVDAGSSDAASHRQTAARVIQALMRQSILSKPSLSSEEDEDELAALSALGAVVVVLVGEIAVFLHHLGARDQYERSLRLADEIAVAERVGWEGALRSVTPVEATARWITFVMRHV